MTKTNIGLILLVIGAVIILPTLDLTGSSTQTTTCAGSLDVNLIGNPVPMLDYRVGPDEIFTIEQRICTNTPGEYVVEGSMHWDGGVNTQTAFIIGANACDPGGPTEFANEVVHLGVGETTLRFNLEADGFTCERAGGTNCPTGAYRLKSDVWTFCPGGNNVDTKTNLAQHVVVEGHCGDGQCDQASENHVTCPADCQAPVTTTTIPENACANGANNGDFCIPPLNRPPIEDNSGPTTDCKSGWCRDTFNIFLTLGGECAPPGTLGDGSVDNNREGACPKTCDGFLEGLGESIIPNDCEKGATFIIIGLVALVGLGLIAILK